jgi:flagellar basal body rod protein FlgG
MTPKSCAGCDAKAWRAGDDRPAADPERPKTVSADGVKLTRDGRFRIDKDGNLLTLEDAKVLSNSGGSIKLPIVPERLSDIVINAKGVVSVFNKETKKIKTTKKKS